MLATRVSSDGLRAKQIMIWLTTAVGSVLCWSVGILISLTFLYSSLSSVFSKACTVPKPAAQEKPFDDTLILRTAAGLLKPWLEDTSGMLVALGLE